MTTLAIISGKMSEGMIKNKTNNKIDMAVDAILPTPTESIHCWLPATSTKGNMMRPWHSLILHGSIYWEMRSATTAPTNWQPAT